jgi:formylglycine-generating enzyme required for sulfatase activity
LVTMTEKEVENSAHQVFISYAREKDDSTDSKTNRQVVDVICSALESEGITYWIDHQYIDAGDKFSKEIKKAMTKSKVMVLIVSSNADRSDWVDREVHYALNIKLNIIPFCIREPCPEEDLEFLLSNRDWIYSSTTPSETDLNRLIKAVRRHLGKEPKETTKSTERIIVKEQLDPVKEEIEEPGEIPEDVEAVKSKAQRVYKNKKGFWEADYGDGIVMVYIPLGEFIMGSNDYDNEKPSHTVFLDGYWMGKYEVTFDQYDKFCEETNKRKPNDDGWGRGKRAVNNVSWNDAAAYCGWLSKKIGLKFKLPTEAQWEKAARGTDKRTYPWGNQEPNKDLAKFNVDNGKTEPVGSYPRGESPNGILDMAGNVWEWCNDWYAGDYYKNSPDKNPQGPESGTYRVLRGGSWESDAAVIRCANRFKYVPYLRDNDVGFRLCQESR